MWLLILLGILVGLVVLLFAYAAIREHISFYTKTTCSICGRETGVKGNCRYKLKDGYMCQPCKEKLYVNKDNASFGGPNLYASNTVESIRMRHQERDVMGEEAWKQKMMEELQAQALAEYRANSVVCCPKCGSTQITANQKGFGVGKAVVGAAVAGPIGLTAGNIGSKKVIITCLKCGHQWKAGKG